MKLPWEISVRTITKQVPNRQPLQVISIDDPEKFNDVTYDELLVALDKATFIPHFVKLLAEFVLHLREQYPKLDIQIYHIDINGIVFTTAWNRLIKICLVTHPLWACPVDHVYYVRSAYALFEKKGPFSFADPDLFRKILDEFHASNGNLIKADEHS